MKHISILLMSLTLSPALIMNVYAAEHTTAVPTAAKPADTASLSSGEIKKIDMDAGKITLKHGPLDNLNMPAMTMVFKVQSPDMLKNVKVGDSVKFRVENLKTGYTVTTMERATP